MIKWIFIGCYVAHKVWWKRAHRETVIEWEDFF